VCKMSRQQRYSLLLPGVAYVAVIRVWASFRTRFLVPFLPLVLVLSGLGFGHLLRSSRGGLKIVGLLSMICSLVWFVISYFQQPITRYYPNDASHAVAYAQMKQVALQLETLPPTPLLGLARSLDGGIEGVYWHRHPFVAGRDLGVNCNLWRQLVLDFEIQRIWLDHASFPMVISCFPGIRPLVKHGQFAVFEFSFPHSPQYSPY
jgi:hypothetical protein